MPATTLSLNALEEKGWFLSQEGLDSLVEQFGTDAATLDQVIELAKDTDLRELTEKGFRKGDLTKLTQLPPTLVLQVLQIQNIAVPSIQHVEKPRLLRVVFTDGSSKKKWIGAEILGQVESISLQTPPGTKFLVTKPIDIREQLLILGPGMLTCLGGQVQEMIQAWKAGKQFIKRTKGNQTTTQEDMPPPFIPFKIKAGQTTKEKTKEPKHQPASDSGNDHNSKNRRSKEKDGKRKDGTATKSTKKKDDTPTKKDSGATTKKDTKPAKKEGGSTKKDSGSTKKDGGQAKKDGGSTKKDNTSAKKDDDRSTTKKDRDGGSTKKEPKPAKKPAKKQVESASKKESGPANEKDRGQPPSSSQDNKKKNQRQQTPKDKTKREDDTGKSNQGPTGDIDKNKSKNKSRNQRHTPSPASQQQQQQHGSPTASNEQTPTVLSASSKPFIPSSFPIQQQATDTSSSSSRGRGSSRGGNRGRGNRGRSRGRGADQ